MLCGGYVMTATMQLENTNQRKAFIADVHFGKFRVLEICAGYGSQALSLKNLGLDIHTDIAEIDKYAIQAYNQLHGETFNYGDVYKIDDTKLPNYDLITYSTPCQDFSVAGKQQGGDKGSGTRSSLLWECERIIKAVKPKYLLMENVKNLVGKKHKHNFDEWLKVLEELGYNNYWQVLNAKDYGIPQNRERVFVVSIRKDLNKTYTFPPKQELKIRLKDILENEVEEKYYLSDKKVERFLATGNVHPSGRGMNGNVCTGDVCNTLTTNKGEGLKILEPLCAASRGRNPDNPSDRTKGIYLEQRLEFNKEGCSNTLTSVQKDNYVVEPKIIQVGNIVQTESFGGNPQRGRIYSPEGCSPALNTMQGGGLEPKIITHNIPQSVKVRKYEVDTNKLVEVLRDHKQKTGLTNNQLAEKLNMPLTKVEHWFRTDDCFSIPDSDIWFELKKLLNIETNEFDLPITEFEEKEGVFEKANRCYHEDGISPTLTSTSADEKIICEQRKDEGLRFFKDNICGTLRTIESCGNKRVIESSYRIRKLTPRECWRLMGVKDEQFDKLHDISNSQLYKLAGNSIVVDVLEHIFRNLLFAETVKPTEQKGQLNLF